MGLNAASPQKKKTAWPTGSAAHGIETMKNAMTYSRCHLIIHVEETNEIIIET